MKKNDFRSLPRMGEREVYEVKVNMLFRVLL